LKKLFATYRPTLLFIVRFLGIYLLLSWLYGQYLKMYAGQTDILTRWVGKAVSWLGQLMRMHIETVPIQGEPGLKLIFNGAYIARVVEGCTGISVIIMFVAFVLSFGQNFNKSLLFALTGSVLIFVFNLFRIVFLAYLLQAYPQYQDLAHRIIFPAFIYGFVVLLWIIFIVKYNEK